MNCIKHISNVTKQFFNTPIVNPKSSSDLSRRSLLKWSGILTFGIASKFMSFARAQQSEIFKKTIGKNPKMIVHNWNPGVLETPLKLLEKYRLTPKQILFVRNNQIWDGALSLHHLPLENWKIEMKGLINPSAIIQGKELKQHKQTEIEMVLQCSGNGRSHYTNTFRTSGTQWGKGGMGNLRWKGVPLKNLVSDLKLKINSSAKFITAEGRDIPPTNTAADFEHSMPIDDVLDKAILAIEMNGEPIPAVHGGPVRLIIPGYYGTMNIKWLTHLRFETEESNNYNHIHRYRTFKNKIELGSNPPRTTENSRPTWRQKINSTVWFPTNNQEVKGPNLNLRGVAWNDGSVKLKTLEISTNQGKNWDQIQLDFSSGPFAWHHWNAQLKFSSGKHQIWVRAVDITGQKQPLDGSINWNPSGYEWNGITKIDVVIT